MHDEWTCLADVIGRPPSPRLSGAARSKLGIPRPVVHVVLHVPLQLLDREQVDQRRVWVQPGRNGLHHHDVALRVRLRPDYQRVAHGPHGRQTRHADRRRGHHHDEPAFWRRIVRRNARPVRCHSGRGRLPPGLRRARHGQDQHRLVCPPRARALLRHFRLHDQPGPTGHFHARPGAVGRLHHPRSDSRPTLHWRWLFWTPSADLRGEPPSAWHSPSRKRRRKPDSRE